MYGQILLTPCTESEHAIRKCDGGPGVQETYFTELFHRLSADTFRAILEVLHKIFITGNNPVAQTVGDFNQGGGRARGRAGEFCKSCC